MARRKASTDRANDPEFVRIFPDQPVTGAKGLDFQFDGLARTLAELAWNPDNAPLFVMEYNWFYRRVEYACDATASPCERTIIPFCEVVGHARCEGTL